MASEGHVAAVSQRTKEDLEAHRAKGHVPFMFPFILIVSIA